LEERKEKEERERRENLHMRSYIHTLFDREERERQKFFKSWKNRDTLT